MQKDKWIESLENSDIFESPLGTPQFSAAYKKFRHMREKASPDDLEDYFSYINSYDKHIESIIPAEEAGKLKRHSNASSLQNKLSDSELTSEVTKLRSESENAILKLKKAYLEKERELFQQIPNEGDLQVLIATRPDILEITTKVSPSPLITPEPTYLENSRTAEEIKSYRLNRYHEQSFNRVSKFGSSINPQELRSIISEIMVEDESFNKSSKVQRYSEIFQSAFEVDIKEKEQLLRKQLEEESKVDKEAMIANFESRINLGIEETKSALNKFWHKKIQELERKLKTSESKFFSPPSQDEENVKEFYNCLLDQKIEEETENFQRILDAKLKSEYEAKLQYKLTLISNKKTENSEIRQPNRAEIDRFREEIESQNEVRIYTEKEAWKKELMPFLIEECRMRLKSEQEQLIAKKAADLKNQARVEIQELIDQVKKDSEVAVIMKIREIDDTEGLRAKEIKEKIKAECYEELKKEQDFRLRAALTDKLKEQLQKDIRIELVRRVEMEIRLRKEDEIREEVKNSIEQEHEEVRKKMENEIRAKIQALEEEFEMNHNHLVMEEVQLKLEKREKELHINYMRKLEKLKESNEKEYQDYQLQQAQKSKQLLSQEKSEVARLRSNLNVLLKKMTESRKAELSKLQSQEELLEKKMRELQYEQQFKEEQPSRISHIQISEKSRLSSKSPTPNKIQPKSPFKEQVSVISPKWPNLDTDLIRSLPRPLPPPTFSTFNTIENSRIEKFQEPPRSPERRLLGKYSSKEMISDLILKNLEEAKQQAWSLLRETEQPPLIKLSENDIDAREFLSSRKTIHFNSFAKESEPEKVVQETKSRHKLYQELLNQRHGVIEPRIR